MPSILHLDSGREMRGGQWQVLRLLEGLAASNIESTLLARADGPLFVAARENGHRVEPLGLTRAILLARQHDLIHAHDARTHTLAAIVRGAPLIVSRRVAFAIGSQWKSRWKYARAARYIAVSDHVKSVLEAGGVPSDRITVIHDGVPLLEPAQGTDILSPANASDPQKGAPLAQESARLAGITLKPSANLERDLASAAMFVYITHAEGLGSGALLAMSAGVPVVASNIGGLREIIRDGENGLLVENTPAAIAAAIRRLNDDPSFARRIGTEARRTVIQRFTVEQMIRRTMEVYRQVLS